MTGSAYPFRGYKRLTEEGGTRVPLLARLPGAIIDGLRNSGSKRWLGNFPDPRRSAPLA